MLVEYNTLDETVSNLNIYAQLPQHISTGFIRLFGLLASFEFAYFIAPHSARSPFISLSFVARGIASSIVLAFMVHLAKTSSRIDFSVSINIPYDIYFLVLYSTDISSVKAAHYGDPTLGNVLNSGTWILGKSQQGTAMGTLKILSNYTDAGAVYSTHISMYTERVHV